MSRNERDDDHSAAGGPTDIGMNKIAALEEERLAERFEFNARASIDGAQLETILHCHDSCEYPATVNRVLRSLDQWPR